LLFAELLQAVCRASELERATGLQAFAFQPDTMPSNLGFDQRRTLDIADTPHTPRRARKYIITGQLWIIAQAVRLLGLSVNRFATGTSAELGVQKNFTWGTPLHISRLRCPMGLPTARQLLSKLPVGGPLSCTSTIARWG